MDNNFKAYDDAADMLKALAHPVRLCIVKGLLQKGRCNVSFMQDCLDLPQSTVSQHLQKLRSAGIVAAERSGLEIHYTIASPKIAKLIEAMFTEDES
ncbi:metalloregulator ArsR/SmtB family transcription factor [Paenibacillus glycanilyticus]|uniref:ArsR/SmtB family transcription factor n=1 Tax=Paenibacillus glycanilyticus TaxID=126569 RepID=UPI00204145BD|nr:metalloregulator ArsR/SmtB family transcription factor [Paenibacillus glycanilyticus]MCM3629324.1 metalloregulator ArsR/SmtB family transcription factor [Paenibacillus glycanilyticus]